MKIFDLLMNTNEIKSNMKALSRTHPLQLIFWAVTLSSLIVISVFSFIMVVVSILCIKKYKYLLRVRIFL